MKTPILASTVGAILALPFAYSATLSISNFSATSSDFFNTAGDGLDAGTGGFVAAYTFATAPSSASELAMLGMNGFIDSVAFTTSNSLDGQFQGTVDLGSTDPNADIYLVVGNGTNTGDSSELALLLTPFLNQASPTSPGSAGTYNPMIDDIVNMIGTPQGADLVLVAVPEPSSALLAGLASLAMLRRRR